MDRTPTWVWQASSSSDYVITAGVDLNQRGDYKVFNGDNFTYSNNIYAQNTWYSVVNNNADTQFLGTGSFNVTFLAGDSLGFTGYSDIAVVYTQDPNSHTTRANYFGMSYSYTTNWTVISLGYVNDYDFTEWGWENWPAAGNVSYDHGWGDRNHPGLCQ